MSQSPTKRSRSPKFRGSEVADAALEASRLYTTAELTTINRAGFPVTVPVVTAFDDVSRRIILSTSIAYRAKVRNISHNPEVLLHYHHRVAARPGAEPLDLTEPQADACPQPFIIRAEAAVVEQDFDAALTYIGYRFRSTKTQPGLYKRLRRPLWRRLYRYYFTRIVIEASPVEVIAGLEIPEGELSQSWIRRPGRRIGFAGRMILRHAPVASVAVHDPKAGLSATEARIQAVLPGLVCAEVPEDAAGRRDRRPSAKACISAFGQTPDLSTLFHASVLGPAEFRGCQVRMRPRASFTTIRPPGLLGDVWIGIDSTLKGARAAAEMGVLPVSEDVLERAFGKKR